MRSRPESTSGGRGTVARHALVVAAGDTGQRRVLDAAWPGWDASADLVIAADGGYRNAVRLGLAPDLLVGDLDSLDDTTRQQATDAGVAVRRATRDKDESDTELAVLEARRLGAGRITILGALGGRRLDHALANIWLLAHPALQGAEVQLVDAAARVSMVTAPDVAGEPVTRRLEGPPEATISLLPLGGDASGITTTGLRYPLDEEPLDVGPARGLSNVRIGSAASVTVRAGRLLVIEQPAAASGLSSDRREVAEDDDPEGR